MKGWNETREAVTAAIGRFPTHFSLRSVPNGIFRISESHSYFNDSDVLMLYTEILKDGQWLSYAKGTERELNLQIIPTTDAAWDAAHRGAK